MPRFHKLEKWSVRDNAFFAFKGQIQRTMECGPKDGVIRYTSIGWERPREMYLGYSGSKI